MKPYDFALAFTEGRPTLAIRDDRANTVAALEFADLAGLALHGLPLIRDHLGVEQRRTLAGLLLDTAEGYRRAEEDDRRAREREDEE